MGEPKICRAGSPTGFYLRSEESGYPISYRFPWPGLVWYQVKDQRRVAAINGRIITRVLIGPNAVSYAHRDDEQLFTDALKRQHIAYGIKTQEGERYITWSAKDNARVQKIEHTVLQQILQR